MKNTYIVLLVVFSIIGCSNLTDIDGNGYETIAIGNQVWMAENLKVTHYRDGTAITNVTAAWSNLSTGAYCYYDNNSSNGDTYGALYNWYAVNNSRNIAPEGWHVPTDAEWRELETYLSNNGHNATEGAALKSAVGWESHLNTEIGTDDYGFTALPGGCRNYPNGSYSSMGYTGYFWSATEANSTNAWYRILYSNNSDVGRTNYGKGYGFAVRLLRD